MIKWKAGEKTIFFLKNLLKGIIWFIVIITAYFLVHYYVDIDIESILKPYLDNTTLVYSTYSLSEILFGIIPPEFFMIWGLRSGIVWDYIGIVFILALISYTAGLLGFLFGNYLTRTITFRYIRKRFLSKYQSLLNKYGAFLILVAALTPLPYSAISMLVGSFHYPISRYMIWASSRFIRFAIYGYIIWEAIA
jgi:uncharacterized membrane protein YdjX (TVP38/TMEM64 family)